MSDVVLSRREALVRAILTTPDDDLVRLAYCDWLEEFGTPDDKMRAEFIRVQCELETAVPELEYLRAENLPHIAIQTKVIQLRVREKELRGGPTCSRCDWHAGMNHGVGTSWTFRRGFVEAVRCKYTDFSPIWFMTHPITRVTLSDRTPHHDGEVYRWYSALRLRPAEVTDAAELPRMIWEKLAAWEVASPRRWVGYRSLEKANDAVSDVMVDLARGMAGLPPLASST